MAEAKNLLTAGSVHTLLYSTPKLFQFSSMLITPYIHCFGLVSIAGLVSVVHAMPTPLVAPPLPVIDITAHSPVKHLNKKLWNALVRITVLDEHDLTKIYDGMPLSTGTIRVITQIINRVFDHPSLAPNGHSYSRKEIRYMNKYGKYQETKDPIIFVVETQTGICSGKWPCVGRRKENPPIGSLDLTKDVPTRLHLKDDWESNEVEPEFGGSFSQHFRAGWPDLKGKIDKTNDEQNRILEAAEKQKKGKKNKKAGDRRGRNPKMQRVEGGRLNEQASGATTSVTLPPPSEGLQQNPNSQHPGGNSENKVEHDSQAPGVTTQVIPPPPENVVSKCRYGVALQSSTEPPKFGPSVASLLNPIPDSEQGREEKLM
ncbi:hypothetical protein BDP27DRAFT_1323429 [Rhodocollybia butyracea]|uniref:Uncharacterized protein n=1 Tax=Rhodocollybia butyracea TaxID=206335 RepID=A0A9P5UA00_9AGAR|nr:hypothetical protein BDP27DRAFT_1323429 [Rhodocollybia butyracea]